MGASEHSYTQDELRAIEEFLKDTGYAYDARQNIFYSVPDPWQRKMGYCSLYDDLATPMGLVFDCEPVRFEYNGKKWLIEFWKGQYGITVGAEIGIYNTDRLDLDDPLVFKGTFYDCAGDDEQLHMAYSLYRDNEVLFTRRDTHWWLTGFILGELTDPALLTMEAELIFEDPGMQTAFLEALYAIGYTQSDVAVDGDTVQISFAEPKSKQPMMRHGPVYDLTMARTRKFVDEYRRRTQDCDNMYDILVKLKRESPLLYGFAVNLGRQKSAYRGIDAIGDRLDERLRERR